MSSQHEIFMQRAIDIALNGKGKTRSNPMVGAVLTYKGEIVSEGYHEEYGGPHAEVNCLKDFDIENFECPDDLCLYVSLEPCCHHGKTPPCVDLVLRSGIRNIVIGHEDPNHKVAGKGIQKLKDNGRNLIVGVLEKECKDINRAFIVNHKFERPYVLLKWAQTKDAYIARSNLDSKWISNELSRIWVHKMRSEVEGILVGKNTAKYDDPELNVRDWEGVNPVRVLLDPNLDLKSESKIFNNAAPTLIINNKINTKENHLEWIKFDFEVFDLTILLDELYNRGIKSVLIEGGGTTLKQFIERGLWDDAIVFESSQLFYEGIEAPKIDLIPHDDHQLLEDKISFYKNGAWL